MDGAVDGDASGAALDALDAAAPRCEGAVACERVVFVTKDPVPVDTVANGDQYCTTLAGKPTAHARIKGRNFQAWTSHLRSTVAERFAHGTMPYVLPGGNGVIADTWDALAGGLKKRPIDRDEEGKLVGSMADEVWTGATELGGFAPPNCNDWTDNTGFAMSTVGKIGGTPTTWTTTGPAATASCNSTMLRLYCFEK